jgi:hypothetical protein
MEAVLVKQLCHMIRANPSQSFIHTWVTVPPLAVSNSLCPPTPRPARRFSHGLGITK